MTIYSLLSGKSIQKLEKEYKNKNYGEFKKDLADVVIGFLSPFQKKFEKLGKNKNHVRRILADGSKKARLIAQKNIKEIKNKVGLNY